MRSSILATACHLLMNVACAALAAAPPDVLQTTQAGGPLDADALRQHVSELRQRGSYGEAIAAAKQALAAVSKAHGPSDSRTLLARRVLASACLEVADHASALPLLREVLTALERDEPQDPAAIASVAGDLAQAERLAGNAREAEALARRAVALAEAALGPHHADTALALNNLGAFLMTEGRSQEAEPLMRRAVRIRERALGPTDPLTAQSVCSLGTIALDLEDVSVAEALLRHSLAVRRRVLPPRHPEIAESALELATLLTILGHGEEAERLASEAFDIDKITFGAGHPVTLAALHVKANAVAAVGRHVESERLHEELIRRTESLAPPRVDALLRAIDDSGRHMTAAGKPDRALGLHRRAVDLCRRSHGTDDRACVPYRGSLAEALYATGQAAEATREGREIVAILEKGDGEPDVAMGAALFQLGKYLLASEGMDEARLLLRRALGIFDRSSGRGSGLALETINLLAVSHVATGEPDVAERLIDDAFDRFRAEPDIRSTVALGHLIELRAGILRRTGREHEAGVPRRASPAYRAWR
ncbi:MAG: tetratricopeptide repeat protein [Planctomycetaceae bacterium]